VAQTLPAGPQRSGPAPETAQTQAGHQAKGIDVQIKKICQIRQIFFVLSQKSLPL
jgi:hypothetical protein